MGVSVNVPFRFEAEPHLIRVAIGDIGPCQVDACGARATIVIAWSVFGYGSMTGYYCDTHAPEAAIERRD